MTDYAELWLMAQRSHKDIFEAALRKDWDAAMAHSAELAKHSRGLFNWFEDVVTKGDGK